MEEGGQERHHRYYNDTFKSFEAFGVFSNRHASEYNSPPNSQFFALQSGVNVSAFVSTFFISVARPNEYCGMSLSNLPFFKIVEWWRKLANKLSKQCFSLLGACLSH